MAKIREKTLHFLSEQPLIPAFLILVLLIYFINPDFKIGVGIMGILYTNSHIMILAIGLEYVFLTGEIDFSITGQVCIISVICGKLYLAGCPLIILILGGILTGIVCGLFNSILIALTYAPSYAITLATNFLFHALAYVISGNNYILALPDWLETLHSTIFLHGYLGIILAIISFALFYYILTFTYFGRYIIAVGDNEAAVRKAGINVGLVRIAAFCICSLTTAISTLELLCKSSYAGEYLSNGLDYTSLSIVFLACLSFGKAPERLNVHIFIRLLTSILFVSVMSSLMDFHGLVQYQKRLIMASLLIVGIALNYQNKRRRFPGSSKSI